MNWIVRYRIKNALLIANLISNAIGVTVINLLVRTSYHTIHEQLYQGIERTALWFIPASFLLPLALTLIYERPIRTAAQRGDKDKGEEASLGRRAGMTNDE